MTWFLLSLTAALGLATADALTKRFFSDLAPYRMGVVRILSTAPWMVLALLFLPSGRSGPDLLACHRSSPSP